MSALALLVEPAIRATALAIVVAAGLAAFRVRRAELRLFAWRIVLYASIVLTVAGRMMPVIPVTVPATLSSSSTRVTTIVTQTTGAAPVSVDLLLMAAAIYALGALWMLARIALGWVVTRRLERGARPIDDRAILAQLARHTAANGLAQAPRLAESSHLFVPLATSVLRPAIILPAAWRQWPAAKIDAILAHEIAHIARRDVLTLRLALIYRAVLWPSPLGWWLHQQLTDLAEQASDEAALTAGVDPATYAETLVGFFAVRPNTARRADWNVAMARGASRSASRRIDFVLGWTGGARAWSRWIALGVAVAIAPALTLAASIEPVARLIRQVSTAAIGEAHIAPLAQTAAPVATMPAKPALVSPARLTPSSVDELREPAGLSVAPRLEMPDLTAPALDTPAAAAAASDDDAAIEDPVLVERVDAKYTTAAMEAKVQGVVWLDVVVRADGTVGDVALVKSLDDVFGLDAQAIAAAKQWRFRPATRIDASSRERVPFSATARLELDFRLR